MWSQRGFCCFKSGGGRESKICGGDDACVGVCGCVWVCGDVGGGVV